MAEPPGHIALPGTLSNVKALLITQFSPFGIEQGESVDWRLCTGNQLRFHGEDSAGYVFLADQATLDDINPQVAARLLAPSDNGAVSTSSGNWRCRGNLADIGKIGLIRDVTNRLEVAGLKWSIRRLQWACRHYGLWLNVSLALVRTWKNAFTCSWDTENTRSCSFGKTRGRDRQSSSIFAICRKNDLRL